MCANAYKLNLIFLFFTIAVLCTLLSSLFSLSFISSLRCACHQASSGVLSVLSLRGVATLSAFHPHRVATRQALNSHDLPQLLPEIFGAKIVNEWIETTVQAAHTESQFVFPVEGFPIEEFQYSVGEQKKVAGSEAEREYEEHDEGHSYGSFFLHRLLVAAQLAYNVDVAEHRDTERQEEEDKHQA